jgi:hypothetical protein
MKKQTIKSPANRLHNSPHFHHPTRPHGAPESKNIFFFFFIKTKNPPFKPHSPPQMPELRIQIFVCCIKIAEEKDEKTNYQKPSKQLHTHHSSTIRLRRTGPLNPKIHFPLFYQNKKPPFQTSFAAPDA